MAESAETRAALMRQDLDNLKQENKNFVRREEFEPIKRVVNGIGALVGAAVGGAIMALILNSKG